MRTAPSYLLVITEAALALIAHLGIRNVLCLENVPPAHWITRRTIRERLHQKWCERHHIWIFERIQAQFIYGQSEKRNNRNVIHAEKEECKKIVEPCVFKGLLPHVNGDMGWPSMSRYLRQVQEQTEFNGEQGHPMWLWTNKSCEALLTALHLCFLPSKRTTNFRSWICVQWPLWVLYNLLDLTWLLGQ